MTCQRVAENTFITDFHSPKIARKVKAGQFVMVSFPNCTDPLLARAFSVSDVKDENLSLLYTAIGKGTTRLSKLRKGDNVLINGPLGNGFPKFSNKEKVWVILGGSGAALIPILYKSAKQAHAEISIFYGARTKRHLVNFKNATPHYATDDGTKGHHGTVLELVEKHLAKGTPDKIFACGPTPMLLALQKSLDPGLRLFVSVETPMACGMGFCQGCPVKIKDANEYLLACKDGPVFDASQIDLE